MRTIARYAVFASEHTWIKRVTACLDYVFQFVPSVSYRMGPCSHFLLRGSCAGLMFWDFQTFFFLTLSGYHLSEASMHPSSLLVQWVELRSYRPQGRSLVLVFPSQSSSVVFRLPCESCQGTQGTHNPGQTADFPKLHCTTEPPRLHIVPLGTFCVRRLRVALLVQTHRGRLSVDRYERRLLS